MNRELHEEMPGISDRIRRSNGRSSRNCVANSRVTAEEQKELEAAAAAEGKALSEWAREVMLREARRGATETAVFTELLALRMLMSTVLRSIALGEKMTGDAYAQILAEVRAGKHEAAKDMLEQYQKPSKER